MSDEFQISLVSIRTFGQLLQAVALSGGLVKTDKQAEATDQNYSGASPSGRPPTLPPDRELVGDCILQGFPSREISHDLSAQQVFWLV